MKMSKEPSWILEALKGHPVVTRGGTKAYIRHYEEGIKSPYRGVVGEDVVVWRHSTHKPEELRHHPYESGMDIVGLWVEEPPTFKYWHLIHPKYTAMAQNDKGPWYLYCGTPEPCFADKLWDNGLNGMAELSLAPEYHPVEDLPWHETLIKRPK